MLRILSGAVLVVLLALPARAADPSKYTVKVSTNPLPKTLKEPIQQLLSDRAVQVLDDKGKPFCELWFRKEVPVKGKPDDLKKGLKYRQIEQSTLLGAVRFAQEWIDFRKQKIKPGVYTLRLAFQPEDGNHQGTAPYNEFCLLVPAAKDLKPGLIDFKELNEMSAPATEEATHAAVLLLFPNDKPADTPALVGKPDQVWVLNWKLDLSAGGQKGTLGIGLTLFGHTKE